MTSPAIDLVRQELKAADGRIIAYFVPAEEMERLRGEIESLRDQIATLERQKNHYLNDLVEVLKTTIPIPPTEEEMLAAVDNSDEVRKIIAELEAQ